ncbi:nucleotidyltransferase [Firmicutes bacterium AM41-11]|nr:nucleotidyltransferase [Firmicutes bacterium AM41-11]
MKKDDAILHSLQDLDLSPTMEKNARDKYQALAKYLESKGLDSDFYPQGSFLIGTTIKPYKDGKDHDYDLDILSILKRKKEETQPYNVKIDVGDCIKESGIYSEKLEKEDKNCWTLKYAEISDGVGFSLDVVPSVDESSNIKNEIILSGVDYSKAEKTVAITEKKGNLSYEWKTSNPLGFGDWFLEISNKHLTSDMKNKQFASLPIEIRMEFASIENIPVYYYRSNLQRAVQFMKRHRDIYYDRSKKGNDKPSSILITALIADCVKDQYFLSVSEIINRFIEGWKQKNISIMKNGKILNPVDLRENLIGSYNYSRLNTMDKWIASLSELLNIDDEMSLKRNLHNDINERAFTNELGSPRLVSPTKPWKE